MTSITRSKSSIAELPGARPAIMPAGLAPMLAVPARRPSTNPGWLFEPKLDGIRCVVFKHGDQIRLQSRRGLDLTRQYPELAFHLNSSMSGDSILDGEIVALDQEGVPSFQLLQQRMNLLQETEIRQAQQTVPVVYFAFDLLHADGHSLLRVPLSVRKKLVEDKFQPVNGHTQLISYFEGNGSAVYEACVNLGFEGIVGKRATSVYEPGRRSDSWVKIKPHQSAEFVVGGYTIGEGSRHATFGSLLLGHWDENNDLIYVGSVGTGFTERLLAEIARTVQPLRIRKCPFKKRPDDKPRCTWLAPHLVAEVKYMHWTQDNKLRAPVFLRFRPDLNANLIVKT